MKALDIIDVIMKIIFFVSVVVIIVWSIQLLLGGSPTINQFNSMLIIMIITILFGFMRFMFNLNREVGEIKVSMKHNFFSVKESFIKVKDDMNLIKGDLNLIKKKLKI